MLNWLYEILIAHAICLFHSLRIAFLHLRAILPVDIELPTALTWRYSFFLLEKYLHEKCNYKCIGYQNTAKHILMRLIKYEIV